MVVDAFNIIGLKKTGSLVLSKVIRFLTGIKPIDCITKLNDFAFTFGKTNAPFKSVVVVVLSVAVTILTVEPGKVTLVESVTVPCTSLPVCAKVLALVKRVREIKK
jgi:hypothetical protein